jgi:GAF domain-containing protein
MEMKPLPETREAIDELEPFEDDDLLERLEDAGHRVLQLVPDCVGLSLTKARNGLTFTLVASPEDIAVLDAMQYLDDGPCIETSRGTRPREFDRDEFLGEDRWLLFAEATAPGVRSTLTLPIVTAGRVTGTVNLYAASRRAFSGLHDEIAEIFQAWAPGAVSNADLSFSTRRRALEAPKDLRVATRVSTAVGIVAATLGLDIEAAAATLRDAAVASGVDEAVLADVLLRTRQHPPDGDPGPL